SCSLNAMPVTLFPVTATNRRSEIAGETPRERPRGWRRRSNVKREMLTLALAGDVVRHGMRGVDGWGRASYGYMRGCHSIPMWRASDERHVTDGGRVEYYALERPRRHRSSIKLKKLAPQMSNCPIPNAASRVSDPGRAINYRLKPHLVC